MNTLAPNWLPKGKRAAVCFTIDDVHPATSTDAYEAGGDLARGALRHVLWLLKQHPKLRLTLFVTADWREISPVPTKKLLARIPFVRERVFLAPILPEGTMRLDRHPAFVEFLKQIPRTEIAWHGLHHVHRGRNIPIEFQRQSQAECERILLKIRRVFEQSDLPFARGMNPPGWNLPENLAGAMIAVGLNFVASARDIKTPVSIAAKTNMSGLTDVSLIFPELIYNGRLVHFTHNFQATSPFERAFEVIENNGLLAVKAHIIKNAAGHIALDGLDENYRNRLDALFAELEKRYDDSLWWTSLGEIAERVIK